MKKNLIDLIAIAIFLLNFPAHAWITFTDVTEISGLDFVHRNGASEDRRFPESIGSGCAFFDLDNDGDLDLYLVNAGDFEIGGLTDQLYRNNGDGTFTDITEIAGISDHSFGVGVCVGDYDGDGWEDLYVCNFKSNILYKNDGDGSFTDVTKIANIGEDHWSASASFFDFDNDQDLDLFVTNYVKYSEKLDGCSRRDLNVYCAPDTFDPERDTLYQNDGDGTFTDVTNLSKIDALGRGLAVICGDYDDDNFDDIFIANDMNQNFLYRNNCDGTFSEIGLISGVALGDGAVLGNGMGIDFADIDNDQKFDLLIANFQDQANALYRNDGDGFFTDVTFRSGIGVPSLPMLAWGCGIVDLDNDGWRDLIIANGHIHDNISEFDDVGTFAQPTQIFGNVGNGNFVEMTDQSGPAISRPKVSRGMAIGDYDNDGDLDLLINNLNSPATLLRNDGGNLNNWIRVKIEPRHLAIGAKVRTQTDQQTQIAEIHSGGSYASHNDTRPIFGIGTAKSAIVSVEWQNGERSETKKVLPRTTIVFRK